MRITRTAQLLPIIENDNGNTRFITTDNTDLMVGDVVYVCGGNYDTHTASCIATYNPFTTKGYIVTDKNDTTNRITLNIPYTGTVLSASETERCFISRTYFVTGTITEANIYEGAYGHEKNITTLKVGKTSSTNSAALSFYNGVFRGGMFRLGQWLYNTTILTANGYRTASTKMKALGTYAVAESVSLNNSGYGYSAFLNGTFGDSSNATVSNVIWDNGTWLGGNFKVGLWKSGAMSSDNVLTTWTNGTFQNGTIREVKWVFGIFTNGTFTGADTSVLSMSYDTQLKVEIAPKYEYKFTVGQQVTITGTSNDDLNNRVFEIHSITTASNRKYVRLIGVTGYSDLSYTLPTITGSEKIGIGKMIGGTFQNGTFSGIMGTSSISGVSWSAGTFNGVWVNGVWTNGTFSRNSAIGAPRWYDGVWYNGTFSNGVWHEGVWNNGTFNGSTFETGIWKNGTFSASVMEKQSGKDTFWYQGFFSNSTASSDIKWYKVEYENGTWQRNLSAFGSTFIGIGANGYSMYTNDNMQLLDTAPNANTSALNLTTGFTEMGIVTMKGITDELSGSSVGLVEGDIIQVDVASHGSSFTTKRLFKRLTAGNITAITDANGQSNGIAAGVVTDTAYFIFNYLNTELAMFTGLTNPQARIVHYPNSVAITGYAGDFFLELRLKSIITALEYGATAGGGGTDNSASVPMGDQLELCVFVRAIPPHPTTDKWLNNTLQVINMNIPPYGTNPMMMGTSGQHVPSGSPMVQTWAALNEKCYQLLSPPSAGGAPIIVTGAGVGTLYNVDFTFQMQINPSLAMSRQLIETFSFV